MTQDEIARAQEAGARAAAQAQAIADAAEPSFLARVEAAGEDAVQGLIDGVTAPFRTASAGASSAAHDVTSAIDNVVSAMKWIGIVVLILVGILAAMWIAAAVFGLRWAAQTLTAIAPDVAKSAVAVAAIKG